MTEEQSGYSTEREGGGFTMRPEWRHTDHWVLRGEGFLVEVLNYQETPSGIEPYTGPNRWNVYAYIYPCHPLSIKLRGNYLHHLLALPLQRVPSDIRYHHDERGELLSIQIGSDYGYVGDDRFSHAHTPEDAWEVFRDAEELYDALENSFREAPWCQISALLSLLAPKYARRDKNEIWAIVERLRGDRQTMIGCEVRS